MKKILVTGGLGFIGSYFVDLALRSGYQVVNIDKRTYAARKDLHFDQNPLYELIEADICDITHLPTGIDYIVNFAAESHVDNSIIANRDFFHSNVRGVYNLLELVRSKDLINRPILVHISTDEVYGSIKRGAFTEMDRLNPSNPYSATKAAADQLVLGWKQTYNLPVIICRSCNNYGYGQYGEKLLAKAIELLLEGRQVPIHGDGTYRREWLYAADNCRAILRIMTHGQVGEVYNISSNEEYSVLEAVKLIIDAMGLDTSYIRFIPNRPGQDIRYSINCDKVRALGWHAKSTLKGYIPTYIKRYQAYWAKRFLRVAS